MGWVALLYTDKMFECQMQFHTNHSIVLVLIMNFANGSF